MHPTLHSLKHPECYSTTRCILQLPQLMYSYTPHTPFPETHRRILPPAVPSNYRSQCMHPTRRSMKHKECQSPTRGTLQLPESVYAFYTPLLETQRLLASLPPAVPCNYLSQCMHFTHRSLKHRVSFVSLLGTRAGQCYAASPTLELVQNQSWGILSETEWSASLWVCPSA